MFTQSCFIRKDTQELRDKLKDIGLQPHPCIVCKACNYLFVNRGFYSRNEIGYQEEVEKAIDCGTNEDLFLAIAALRDDTDKNQWFVHNDTGFFMECTHDEFHLFCFNPFDALDYKDAKDEFHKATVEELIEHFSNKTD